jgi:phage portal protein BeeE
MAKLWQLLLGRAKDEERLTLDDWAKQLVTYQGTDYLLSGYNRGRYGNKQEPIGENFESYVHNAYEASGVVFACHQARQTVFSEARFAYQRLTDGRPGTLFDSPGLDLLEKPWPGGSTAELLARAIQDVDFAGNHFVVRRDHPKLGPRLYRLRPDWVTILMTAPPNEATYADIEGYLYRPGGTEDTSKWEYFRTNTEDGRTRIAHWSPIPDPLFAFRGMSWLTPVVREIMADKAIGKHKLTFFERGTVPGMVFSFKETVTPEKFREFMKTIDETKAGADNAYENLYLGGGADVTVVGAQMLDFKAVGSVGENRIAAAARVHPAIVGLSDGLIGSSLNAGNYESAKHQFGDGTIRPLWRSLCAAYSVLIPELANARLWYDDRDIPFLAEDHERLARTQQLQATTISRYVMQGYTPESAVLAVNENNLELLEHTGLYSVQLLPPDVSHPEGVDDEDEPDSDDDEKKPDDDKDAPDKDDDGKKVSGSGKQVGPYRKPRRK